MGRGKRRSNKRKRKHSFAASHGLSGVQGIMEHPVMDTVTKGGLVILAAIAAGGAGAALGKHSLIAGVPVALWGFHKKNPYIIAAGLGLTMSNGFQKPGGASESTQGVDGFDVKQIAGEAKDRVGTFFKNFSQKLYLPATPEGANGLQGDDSDEVTYFMNPYGTKELDMSAIDRVQEQIAQMNQTGTSGLEESEREF